MYIPPPSLYIDTRTHTHTHTLTHTHMHACTYTHTHTQLLIVPPLAKSSITGGTACVLTALYVCLSNTQLRHSSHQNVSLVHHVLLFIYHMYMTCICLILTTECDILSYPAFKHSLFSVSIQHVLSYMYLFFSILFSPSCSSKCCWTAP